jgi:hypothetical protein
MGTSIGYSPSDKSFGYEFSFISGFVSGHGFSRADKA